MVIWPCLQNKKRQEKQMSKITKFAVLASFAALVAACGGKEEEYVVVEPEPISTEPAFTGKYK